ncbi:odorant receptor 46a-like [Myzus persicae]|uniref:odorant receptor 46a-like n=1 Tax=Myzus persicae TaxID=13164 RepID=UPI000B9372B3|nr:odorant receptor 46a-like [Myzus persicae]
MFTDTSFDVTHLEKRFDALYDDLKIIITDHQTVIRKLKEYCTIFRPVALFQIFITSSSHIVIWFVAAMSFGENDLGDSTTTFKLFTVHPLISFQLFMTCWLYGSINEKKDSIIFALYSSNWTAVDIKCKKLILLAMKINNANHLKLKFTNTKIVNLEMFTQTMRFCYTIFSMLVKYNYNKTTN